MNAVTRAAYLVGVALAGIAPPTEADRVAALDAMVALMNAEDRRLAGLRRSQIADAQREAELQLVAVKFSVFRQAQPGASRTAARPWIVARTGLPEWRVRGYLCEIGRRARNRPHSGEAGT